jgi:Cu2+-exporting ATPase
MAVHSRHPLAKAMVQSWISGSLIDLEVEEITGSGLQACNSQGKIIYQLGSQDWCGDKNAISSSHMQLWFKDLEKDQTTCFEFEDQLRSDSREILQHLKQKSYGIHILSGDRASVVETCAQQLEVDQVQSLCRPQDKVIYIENLKSKNHKVAMVGDGLNDTPVLAAADVALSPSSAIDMAQNRSDIIFSGKNLAPVLEALLMAKDSQAKIKQNFALAVFYNILAVPLAVMGFVTPMVAALAMSLSSLIVVGNSFRLRQIASKINL